MKLFLSIVFVFCMTGCTSTPADKLAFQAIDTSWRLMSPEYLTYVESDVGLTDAQKQQRRALVADITALLEAKVKQ